MKGRLGRQPAIIKVVKGKPGRKPAVDEGKW